MSRLFLRNAGSKENHKSIFEKGKKRLFPRDRKKEGGRSLVVNQKGTLVCVPEGKRGNPLFCSCAKEGMESSHKPRPAVFVFQGGRTIRLITVQKREEAFIQPVICLREKTGFIGRGGRSLLAKGKKESICLPSQ